tara:strand:+ start:797 stop:1018 length:222 start_codon:yes stop_codon:yes gene_type:complete
MLVLKRVFQAILFNSCLFVLLVVLIQNSSNKGRVNLIINETIMLPTSFILGVSFIAGSLTGNLLTINYPSKSE